MPLLYCKSNQYHRATQTENINLKDRLDYIQEDVKNLIAINATLENRIETEKNSEDFQTGNKDYPTEGVTYLETGLKQKTNTSYYRQSSETFTRNNTTYQDFKEMCCSMPENGRHLSEMRDQSEKVEHMQLEYTTERLRLEQDKTTAEMERITVNQDLNLYVGKASGWTRDIDEASDTKLCPVIRTFQITKR